MSRNRKATVQNQTPQESTTVSQSQQPAADVATPPTAGESTTPVQPTTVADATTAGEPTDTVAGGEGNDTTSGGADNSSPSGDDTAAQGDAPVQPAAGEAAAVQQPTAPVTPPPAPPAPAPVAPVVEEKDDVYAFIRKKYPGRVNKLPLSILGIIEKMDAYVLRMKENAPVTEQDGTGYQLQLFVAFNRALSQTDGLHVFALDVIQWYFDKHQATVFSPRLACRFLVSDRFTQEKRDKLTGLINLFQLLVNPETRRELNKHVNMDVLVRRFSDLVQQKNLMSYVTK